MIGATPTRLVTVTPSFLAVAEVRSYWTLWANGPRSITLTTTDLPL